MEMKSSGQSKVLLATTITITTPSKGVIVVGPTSQTPTTPYAAVAQVQPVRVQRDQQKKQSEDDTPIAQIKLERLVKVKQEPTPPSKKRVKQSTSGPGKRRKTLQIGDSKESQKETEEKPVEQVVRE